MYVPSHFAETDRARILAFLRAQPFGLLVSIAGGRPFATHVPFVVLDEGEPLVLGAHVARANPQWKSMQDAPVMAVFEGAHAHVSAAWYEHPEKTVPTWDYAAVHCSGNAAITGASLTHAILEQLVREHEGGAGWTMQTAPEAYIEQMLQAIVGIHLTVERVDAQFKYSQNRTPADRERVIAQLSQSPDPLARELAGAMREYYVPEPPPA